MGQKDSTGRKRAPRKASDVKRLRKGRPASRLVAERLQLLLDQRTESRSAFARSVGASTTHVTNWLTNGIAPSAAMLTRIAERRGVSVDWLLGFDVPADRDARCEVGALASQLFEALMAGKPSFASESLLGEPVTPASEPGRAASLLREVTTSWWEMQRALLARDVAPAVQALADRLQDDASEVTDVRVATLMRQQSREQLKLATVLRAGDPSWRDLARLRPGRLCAEVPGVTAVAVRFHDESAIAYLRAPFLALGGDAGIGVAWRRSTKEDEAWFIDADSLEVRRERGRKFLVDLTIADRHGPLLNDV